MNNKKSILFKITALTAVFTLNVSLYATLHKNAQKVDAYDSSSLPTTIDLNDCTEQEIRSYYSGLNSLIASERKGTNLLKNLKPILSNNQKYYNYDSGSAIWQLYEITDRDWIKSPASSITYGSYNASTNKITNYQYGTSASNSKNNPYIHALYINRNVTNQVTAWDDHQQTQWGINREHIWAKSHGFQDDKEASGGARGDPMHLWAANGYANNIHSNYFYAFVDKTKSYTDCGSTYSNISNNLRGISKNIGSGTVFEPQDCDKGDIARSIFYMAARYNNYAGASSGFDTNNPNLVLLNDLSENTTTGTSDANTPYGMGLLRDLLAWNKLDPVDEYEIHRNNLLYKNYTNNRNPFIDFPNWADAIWGTANLDGTNYNSNITTSASPATDPINAIESNTFGISAHSLELEVDGTAQIYATNADGNISWSISDNTVASLNKTSTSNNEKVTVTALKAGTTTITATSGGVSLTCTVTVGEVTHYGTLDNPLSVDDAIELINNSEGNVPAQPLYVKGIVTSNSEYKSKYDNFDYAWLQSDDGSDEQAFELYRFKFADSDLLDDYSEANSMVGKQVIAYGYGKKYNGTPELATSSNDPNNPLVYEISDVEPTGIELDQDTANIDVGETVTLTASLIPSNAVATIVWESSDESVATVNNGVVTGVKGGQATITVRASEYDLDAECVVTVNSAAPTPNDYLTNASSIATLHGEESSSLQSVTESLALANASLSNAEEIDDVHLGGVIIDGDIGSNDYNNPKYYTKDASMRVYPGNTLEFTSSDTITSITFTYVSGYSSTLTADSGSISNNTWTGNTNTVTFTDSASTGSIRITNLSITYSKQALTVNSLCMRMGAVISVSDWTAINDEWPITDYGVMLFRTTEARLSLVNTVKEYFELGEENVTIIRKGSGNPGTPINGHYDFSVQINITKVSNYNRYYCAAPFIVAGGNYYFLEEMRYSINSLAAYYQTHGGCDLSSAALEYLATAH